MMDIDGRTGGPFQCCPVVIFSSFDSWNTWKHIKTSAKHFPQPIEPMKTFKNGSKLFEIMFADRKFLMMDDDHSRKSLWWPLLCDDHDRKSLWWPLMGGDHDRKSLWWWWSSAPQADAPSSIVMTSWSWHASRGAARSPERTMTILWRMPIYRYISIYCI